jgi:multidrug efflux pump subunit AcrB
MLVSLSGAVLLLVFTNKPSAEIMERVVWGAWWNWPRVFVPAVTLTVAHWIGIVAVLGLVVRSAMFVFPQSSNSVVASTEQPANSRIVDEIASRLRPATNAAVAVIAVFLPLALAAPRIGIEPLRPLAIVVIGGTIGSMLVDRLVTPAVVSKLRSASA